MKKSRISILSALLALAMVICMTASAGAESLVDTILNTGTAQAFTSEAVPDEDIRTILQAGVSTASAINQQPWFLSPLPTRT
jgi:Nitroreductase